MFMRRWFRSVMHCGFVLLLVALLAPMWPTIGVRAGTFVVSTTSDSGVGSLRYAIQQLNAMGGGTITFNIPGNGVQTIAPTPLYPILAPMIIDATTQPNYVGTPLIEISGTNDTASGDSLFLIRGGGTTIKGFAINGYTNGGTAINIASSGNTIQGNYIGTDPTGNTAKPNETGIFIQPSSSSASASNNTIGGTTPATRNIVSGNNGNGIAIDGSNGGTATNNTIEGNYVGINAAGTALVKNPINFGSNKTGVTISSACNNTIGGTMSGARNVVSGNEINNTDQGPGISIEGRRPGAAGCMASGNVVQGNFVGTDATGTYAIPNSAGVYIDTANGNTVGGTMPAARNLVSGNTTIGITVDGSFANGLGTSATQNIIEGNYVGTDVTGTVAIANATGVDITAANSNTVGGTASGAGNLISGNTSVGVNLEEERDTPPRALGTVTANSVQGNLIGTTAAGNAPLNNGTGVALAGGSGNTIGGAMAAARIVIYGFTRAGVLISPAPNHADSHPTANVIQGNYIGIYSPAVDVAPTAGKGVILTGASGNTVGGGVPGEGNVIAFKDVGVQVDNAVSDRISSNPIYGNTATLGHGPLNIWLSNGGNNNQAAPVLTSAAPSAPNQITIGGSLNSTANHTFHIEFFATPNATNEGRTFLGSTTRDVMTNGAGAVSFSAAVSAPPAGQYATATATDTTGNININNTSAFSDPHIIMAGPPASLTANPGTTPQSVPAGNPFVPLAVTVRDASGSPVGAGFTVTFTAPRTGPSGTFPGGGTTATAQTNASGVASIAFTGNMIGGTYQVTASVTGLPSATFTLTNAPNAEPPPRPGPAPSGGPPRPIPTLRT